jgi:hypothetical protein
VGQEQVFISYRRDDSAGYARALHDALARRFGAARIFIDVDDIAAGQRFAHVIAGAVGRAQVLLVLIGPRWLGLREGAPPRLHEPGDFVRREVEAGLARGVHVVPVLLDGTPMPAAAQLPATLRALADCHAVELRGSRWEADLADLLDAVAAVVGDAPPGTADTADTPATPLPAAAPRGRARRRALGAGLALLAGAAALLAWWRGPGGGPRRAAVNGRWIAEVVYPWPNARYDERLELAGDGADLRGSASYLGLPRGIVQGRVEGERLQFQTRTQEIEGGIERVVTHRYEGRLDGGRLALTLRSARDGVEGPPLDIVARREGAPPPAPPR